jgi:hypothetical protein
MDMRAMEHLGNVLTILAELHSDDRCNALEDALAFYNEHNPGAMIEPEDGFETRLVHVGPLWYAIAAHRARTETAQKQPSSTETNVNEQRT